VAYIGLSSDVAKGSNVADGIAWLWSGGGIEQVGSMEGRMITCFEALALAGGVVNGPLFASYVPVG
jgi:hypothetical protein